MLVGNFEGFGERFQDVMRFLPRLEEDGVLLDRLGDGFDGFQVLFDFRLTLFELGLDADELDNVLLDDFLVLAGVDLVELV